MAFKDGMYAIAKVLSIAATGAAAVSVAVGLYDAVAGRGGFVSLGIGLAFAAFLFVLFWTPSWVIKKFIQ